MVITFHAESTPVMVVAGVGFAVVALVMVVVVVVVVLVAACAVEAFSSNRRRPVAKVATVPQRV